MNGEIAQIVQSIRNIVSRLRLLETREQSLQAWVAPTLLNSWVNGGFGFNTAGYWKDPWGVVHLRGFISGGVSGTSMFLLPAGYRPQFKDRFPIWANSAFGSLEVQSSGNVTMIAGTSPVFLDGITFRAYQ